MSEYNNQTERNFVGEENVSPLDRASFLETPTVKEKKTVAENPKVLSRKTDNYNSNAQSASATVKAKKTASALRILLMIVGIATTVAVGGGALLPGLSNDAVVDITTLNIQDVFVEITFEIDSDDPLVAVLKNDFVSMEHDFETGGNTALFSNLVPEMTYTLKVYKKNASALSLPIFEKKVKTLAESTTEIKLLEFGVAENSVFYFLERISGEYPLVAILENGKESFRQELLFDTTNGDKLISGNEFSNLSINNYIFKIAEIRPDGDAVVFTTEVAITTQPPIAELSLSYLSPDTNAVYFEIEVLNQGPYPHYAVLSNGIESYRLDLTVNNSLDTPVYEGSFENLSVGNYVFTIYEVQDWGDAEVLSDIVQIEELL